MRFDTYVRRYRKEWGLPDGPIPLKGSTEYNEIMMSKVEVGLGTNEEGRMYMPKWSSKEMRNFSPSQLEAYIRYEMVPEKDIKQLKKWGIWDKVQPPAEDSDVRKALSKAVQLKKDIAAGNHSTAEVEEMTKEMNANMDKWTSKDAAPVAAPAKAKRKATAWAIRASEYYRAEKAKRPTFTFKDALKELKGK